MELDAENVPNTARGIKAAHGGLRGKVTKPYGKIVRSENRLGQSPTRVLLQDLEEKKQCRGKMKTDRRNLANAVKVSTYYSGRLLAWCFSRYYDDPRDYLEVFRPVVQLLGAVSYRSIGCMSVD